MTMNRIPNVANAEPLSGEGGFDLRDAINFVWRQWRLIAGITALALVLGAAYLARQVPIYTASAQVLLDPRRDKAVGKDDVLPDAPLDLPGIESQMAIIRSSVLLRRVVEKERLVNDPEFGAAPSAPGTSLLGGIRALFGGKSNDAAQAVTGPSAADIVGTVENIKSAVTVTRSGQAYILLISFNSADPAKAARLANAVADAYLVDKLDARFEAAKRASGWLSDRLEEVRRQLRDSEEAVAQFRADHNLVRAGAGTTLNQEQLGQLNSRLVSARADAAEKRAKVDLLDKLQQSGASLLSMPDVANSGGLVDLRRQDGELSRQEADLLARYGDGHPSVVNIRAQRRDIQRSIGAEASRTAANIRNDYSLAKARQEAVEKTLQEVSGQTGLDESAAISLRELERTTAVNKSLFEDFLQRARITQEQSTFEARDARVITPALPPGSPSAPKRALIMLATLGIGLAAGAAAAYLTELLNAGFKTPKEIEDFLRLPLLGALSRMDERDLTLDGKVIAIPQYPLAKPLSRLSEAIRSIRSGIQMADVDDPPKVLQVTSTVPGEGKSTIALTIAASAAQTGAKVLIIDCDLRHPSTSKFFGLDKSPGLVDYLTGQVELRDIVTYQERTNCWVLPAGARTQNPPDLLGSERLKTLVAQLREKFDFVLIDTPPMGPVVDPIIASAFVDRVLFVVRWASTAREMVQRAVDQMSAHRKIAGVVFNMVDDERAQKYGKYAYSYYYGGHYYKKYYSE